MAVVYDALASDVCLGPLLDREEQVTHGTDDWCDEPTNRHTLWAVRREQQGFPGHFSRAVVTFGRFGKIAVTRGQHPPVA